jgi:hypothetical protein
MQLNRDFSNLKGCYAEELLGESENKLEVGIYIFPG